jgi:hypothetical protein
MSRSNVAHRLRVVALVAMFCLVDAAAAAASTTDNASTEAPGSSSLSGYIIAVG